jgi:hypothetical protein
MASAQQRALEPLIYEWICPGNINEWDIQSVHMNALRVWILVNTENRILLMLFAFC